MTVANDFLAVIVAEKVDSESRAMFGAYAMYTARIAAHLIVHISG